MKEVPVPNHWPDGLLRGVRGLLVYCSEYRCSLLGNISADPWTDEVRLSDPTSSEGRTAALLSHEQAAEILVGKRHVIYREPVPRSRFDIGPALLLQLHHPHHA